MINVGVIGRWPSWVVDFSPWWVYSHRFVSAIIVAMLRDLHNDKLIKSYYLVLVLVLV